MSTEIVLVPLSGNVICSDDSTVFVVDPVNTDSLFSYQISIGNNIFNLGDSSAYFPPGNYIYSVEIDTSSGFIPCFSNQSIQILENDLNIDSVSVIDETCITSKGSISVFASSSFAPINYSVSINPNYQSSPIITDLSSQYYTINVIDNMSCVVSQDSIYVDLVSGITLDIDSSLETCLENDGWIKVIANGGFGSYQYSIDSGLTASSPINSDTLFIDSLSKGDYYLVIIDDSLCMYEYGNIYIGKTPRPKIDSIITVNESCCGYDGSISIYASPALSISEYSLDTLITYQSNNLFDSLYRGSYLVYVKDTNSCLDSIEVYLDVDSVPNINLTVGITDVVCNGDSNGTFKVYYPDNCYSYELYRYTFSIPQVIVDTGVYFNHLIPGFYGVIATSSSGTCIDSSSVKFINEPSPIIFDDPTIKDVRCIYQDSCNGEVFFETNPNGGMSPYYYYLKDVTNNIPMGVLPVLDTFSLLCPSEYIIEVIDANACIVYDTIVIADSSLRVDSFSISSISCYNGNNGSVEVFVNGGSVSYNYLWSTNDTTQRIDSLNHGEYFISITDSLGCFIYDSIFLSQPDTLQFKIIENGKKPETCMGVTSDGEIYLEITGGTPPYNYMWNSFSGFSGNSGSGFGDTIFNLTYDTIMIDITDANYCSGSPTWGTVNVTIVDALNAHNPLSFDSIYYSDPICHASNSGFIRIELNGGDSPILYSIDSGQVFYSTDSFSYLSAGEYHIYVMDTYGCLESELINIKQHDELIIHHDSIKHVSCYEGNDGYIQISASGGISPYTYFWLPTLETTSVISNLYAVPHIIQSTDSVGCIVLDTINIYELTDPIQTQSSVISEVSCFNGLDGVLFTDPIGGMPSYDYLWINQDLDTVSFSQYAYDLSSGVYTVVISDSFDCGPAYDTIFMKQSSQIELDVINILDNICHGESEGEMIFSISGGHPSYVTYLLDQDNNQFYTYNSNIAGLSSSDYFIWSVDSNGCHSDTLEDVKLGGPGRIKIMNHISDLNCFGSNDGMMNISFLSGTSPYTFVVEDNLGILEQGLVNQTVDIIVGSLEEGEYSVFVTDFNGCMIDSTFTVNQPEQIIADFISSTNFGAEPLMFSAENISIGGQVFYWDFDNGSSQIASFLEDISTYFIEQGEYNVTLVAHDTILGEICNDTMSYIVNVEGYDVYNVFTPNNDGVNDLFYFNEWMINGIYVEIYNRWGEKIYHWDQINSGWDGKLYNGREAEEGVYFYRMQATGVDGTHFEENGNITLLR